MNKKEFIEELKKINIELTKQQLTLLEEYYIILKEENECPICGSSLIIKPTDDKEELACSNEKCSYHRDINEN